MSRILHMVSNSRSFSAMMGDTNVIAGHEIFFKEAMKNLFNHELMMYIIEIWQIILVSDTIFTDFLQDALFP